MTNPNRGAKTRPHALPSSTIVIVHNLRNRFFLPEHGIDDIPLMISAVDIAGRPYLQRAIRQSGIKAHLGARGAVMIDSGGFSMMMAPGRAVQVGDLIDLYRSLDADVLAALDVPPTPCDSAAVRATKWRRTLKNLDSMLGALGSTRLMPVIHGRTIHEISDACRDVRRRIRVPQIVALGGMVPLLRGTASHKQFSYRRWTGQVGFAADFVADAVRLCREEFPNSRLHVFGVGSPTTAIALLALGADSVDSLAWRRAAGYGTIFLAGCAERIVSTQQRRRLSRPSLSPEDLTILAACGCPICSQFGDLKRRITILAGSYVARAVHNVSTLLSEQQALRHAKATNTLGVFLTSRVRNRHRLAAAIAEHVSS